MKNKTVSVIIPCYRSEKYLKKTVSEILAVFSGTEYTCRIILVNDASPDGTFQAVRELAGEYPGAVTGIDLKENAGQARAKMAGLAFAEKGGIVIFMDDDGQHDPRTIFKIIKKLELGYDLVYAQFPRLKETFPRRCASRILDFMMEITSKKPRNLRITSFFGVSPRAVHALSGYRSLHPFIGGFLMSNGFRVSSVHSSHRARKEGTSRYTLKKLAGRALELCFLYRIPPRSTDPPMFEIKEVTADNSAEASPLHP